MCALKVQKHLFYPDTESETSRANEAKDGRISVAIKELSRAGFGQQINLNQLAATLNLSESRFRHLFTKEAGTSPRRYIRLVRIHRAKNLLEQPFSRVKEVMQMVGYSDPSHFVRDYRSVFSCTPSTTREDAWLRNKSGSVPSVAKIGNK